MRQNILLILSFVFTVSVYSQERIVTVEGDTVYAKIIEVNDSVISYKRYNYQEGATFVLTAEKIKQIIWANGDIDVYEGRSASNTLLPGIIEKKWSTFILDNGTEMSEDEFEFFMMSNKLERYWDTYKSGNKLFNTGRGLLIGGAGGILGGAAIVGFSYLLADGSLLGALIMMPFEILGYVVMVAGAAVFTVGIPLALVGKSKRYTFIDDYNEHCAGRYPSEVSENVISWKLTPSFNGLSFTLNF
ncbi:MAG: hypothetical protein LBG80_03695 [Bacteroidales bacterium]|jgi:hypothetical protein|nr:hypothetical protein [Bacteroidales bacterium]